MGRDGLSVACILLFLCYGCAGRNPESPRTSAAWESLPVLSESASSPAADSADHSANDRYPAAWTWDEQSVAQTAAPAVSGTPVVKQMRNGQLIATYSFLGYGATPVPRANSYLNPEVSCGPFHRSAYRNWADGDIFEVYPAVYQGVTNQPYFGPQFDTDQEYASGIVHAPRNITIRGITVNGFRPVIRLDSLGASNNTLGQGAIYFDSCENIVVENIDVDGNGFSVGKAGVYINGGKNITLRDMRVHGFRQAHGNGVFGTPENRGVLTLERVELFDNGGSSGPEHNVYINESAADPAFTVHVVNCWSHDVFYGHIFKSRAQINILEGNYFQGGVPLLGETQADAFVVDVPNGGQLIMRNNIVVKNNSGTYSNGVCVAYGEEGAGTRKCSITIENNTFVAFARFYDTQDHTIYPFMFYYPAQIPGQTGFPVANSDVSIGRNVFVGFGQGAQGFTNYRGRLAYTADFVDLNRDFSLKNKLITADHSILGTPAYRHVMQNGVLRTIPTVGAID